MEFIVAQYEVQGESYGRICARLVLLLCKYNLIQNNQAVKKCATLKKAMVKKDVKSKVAAKKWL